MKNLIVAFAIAGVQTSTFLAGASVPDRHHGVAREFRFHDFSVAENVSCWSYPCGSWGGGDVYERDINLEAKIIEIGRRDTRTRARVEVTRVLDGVGKRVGNEFVIQYFHGEWFNFKAGDRIRFIMNNSNYAKERDITYYHIDSRYLSRAPAEPSTQPTTAPSTGSNGSPF